MLVWDWAYVLAAGLVAGGVTAMIFGIRRDHRAIASAICATVAMAAGAALLLAGAVPALAALAGMAAGLACANALLDLVEGLVADIASFIIGVTGLGAAVLMVPHGQTLTTALLISAGGGLLAAAILGGVAAFYRWRSGQSGLGSGDIVLAGAAGIWAGVSLVGISLLIACVATFLIALITRRLRERIAFAPGLALGFGAAFVIRVSAWPDLQL